MSLHDRVLCRFGAAKLVQIEMMVARGHAVPPHELELRGTAPEHVARVFARRAVETGQSIADAMNAVYDADTSVPPPQGTHPPRTAVVYLDLLVNEAKKGCERQASSDQALSALEQLRKYDVKRGIVVAPSRPSCEARRHLEDAIKHGLDVQVLSALDDLRFPVVAHDLVPQHTACTAEQGHALLTHYRSTRAQLPRMLVTDPVARYFGYTPGTIVRIVRGHGEVTFRVVVPASA